MSAYRYNGADVDLSLAKSEAERLERAIRDKTFYHEDVVRILTTRSRPQLVATFNHYKDAYGISISEVHNLTHNTSNFDPLISFLFYSVHNLTISEWSSTCKFDLRLIRTIFRLTK